jgi:hypothetical protein
MLAISRRYKKLHVVGGAGIFDTVAGLFKRLVTSNAAKQLASSALSAGKQAAKEIGQKAIDAAKDKAVDVGKRLVEKAFSPKITQENKVILSRLLNMEPSIPNNMQPSESIMGHGLYAIRMEPSVPIRIQDLVKRLNGAGLKVA